MARTKGTRYNKIAYNSSKFRFIRHRRRIISGFKTKAKIGINLFTVKYKKGGTSYYLTTRSVPSTNARNFVLPPGHSEDRFLHIRKKFEKRHKLKPTHLRWAATEREPCGHGPGLANCRICLANLGIPDHKIYFSSEYPDGEDCRQNLGQKPSQVNDLATAERAVHAASFLQDVQELKDRDYESEDDSEDEANLEHEYESDYGEDDAPRLKRLNSRFL